MKISTLILDRPGELQRLLAVMARSKANVIHVYHDRVERNVPIGQTVVEVSLDTRDAMHTDEILSGLRKEGYHVKMI